MRSLASRFFKRKPDILVAESIRLQRNAMARESDKDQTIRVLTSAIQNLQIAEQVRVNEDAYRHDEMVEALAMGGAGPIAGIPKSKLLTESDTSADLREAPSFPYIAAGAYGDAELMLNNIQWKREVNLSWLEFTRWGIQQIQLIARLRCIKDPMLKRGMNVSAQYVFGRGVQISSPDPDVDKLLKEWRARNKAVLGHTALTELERSKYYDGNIFFICYTDEQDSGNVTIRTIDALEITDALTNPNDTSQAWYYKREWIEQSITEQSARGTNVKKSAWYPALNFEPKNGDDGYFDQIEGIPVQWDYPVYHRKAGSVPAKWRFGLPEVYAALGWGESVRRFLQDCMTIRNSLAQFSMILTTKGGQQALQGAKQQLSTTVGPNASLWDQNPPAVAGAVFASGPGTTLAAFNSKGAGGDPDDVRQYKLMVCCCFGLPESFFGDMNTSNLATATSLDRPTELNFMEKQEIWVDDLEVLSLYQIRKSKIAVNGKLREALEKRNVKDVMKVREVLTPRVVRETGGTAYDPMWKPDSDELTAHVVFPAIIEADVPARVGAIVNAMTLGSKMGTVTGIDEKVGVGLLFDELGVKDSEEKLDDMYPEATYEMDRTKEPEPVPQPTLVAGQPAPNPEAAVKESEIQVRNAVSRLRASIRRWEKQIGSGASD